jgi:hypothetical protein
MKKSENEVPRVYLETALEKFRESKMLTENSWYTVQDICRLLGFASKSGRSQAYVTSLSYYGVLDRRIDSATSKAEYKISKLGVDCRKQPRDKMSVSLLEDMALSPKTFREVYKNFLGRNINKVSDRFFKDKYGLAQKPSEDAAKVFARAMQAAELVNDDDILINPGILQSSSDDNDRADSTVEDTRKTIIYLADGVEVSFPAEFSARIWQEGAAKVFDELQRDEDGATK